MDEVKLKENGAIKSGTLSLLVDYLIETNTDPATTEVFLAAATAFAPAKEVWTIVERKYRHYKVARESAAGRNKVLNFLWEWVSHDLHRDFLSKASKRESGVVLYEDLLRFINGLDDRDTINKWKLHILKSAALRRSRRERKNKLKTSDSMTTPDISGLSLSGNSSNGGSMVLGNTISAARRSTGPALGGGVLGGGTPMGMGTPLKRPAMTMSGSLLTAAPSPPPLLAEPASMGNLFGAGAPEKVYELGKFTFMEIDAADAARQLTLLEASIFRKIAHTEFHHLNWKKEDGKKIAPNILKLVERFNQVSYWVATEIVMQSELRDRVACVRRFITIAEHLRDLGNYNGVMEIIGGLNNFVVSRLQATWASLSQRYTATFNDLNLLMESKSNYRDYRAAMRERRGPVLPYLGVILRDILFIEEGNKNFVGDSKDQVINFEKIQLLGEVLIQVRKQQENVSYPFDNVSALQQFFLTVTSLPEENLYKQSLMCEGNNPPPASLSGSQQGSSSDFGSVKSESRTSMDTPSSTPSTSVSQM